MSFEVSKCFALDLYTSEVLPFLNCTGPNSFRQKIFIQNRGLLEARNFSVIADLLQDS